MSRPKCPECGSKDFTCSIHVRVEWALRSKRGGGMKAVAFRTTRDYDGTYHVECANPECRHEFVGAGEWLGMETASEYEDAIDVANSTETPVFEKEFA